MATNTLAILGQIFYEPSKALEAIKADTRAWVPLLLLTFLGTAIMYWYFATVDFPWLIDHMIAANDQLKPEERLAMRKFLSADVLAGMSLISALVMPTLIAALTALYYLIAAKLLGSDFSYGKWFGFSVWVGMPRLLIAPLMVMQILSSRGQVMLEDLNMSSLNFLLFNWPAGHPWASWGASVDLTMIWSIVLSTLGLRIWIGRRLSACAIISLLPFVLIYGGWAAKIAFFP